MKNIEIVTYKRRLDELFKTLNMLPIDAEIQAHWAKYLCVLSSGFLESATRAIFREYARRNASIYVLNYVESKIKYFQNARMNDIIALSREFNPQWAINIESMITDELKAAVDSIVNNKNQISHGQNVTISFNTIRTYYERAVKVIEFLEQQTNP